jgi:hypothetical protein
MLTETSPFAKMVHRGEWPSTIMALPINLTEAQLAYVLGVTVRTCQRRRAAAKKKGKPWIPHKKVGKSITYGRDDTLAFYGIDGRRAA